MAGTPARSEGPPPAANPRTDRRALTAPVPHDAADQAKPARVAADPAMGAFVPPPVAVVTPPGELDPQPRMAAVTEIDPRRPPDAPPPVLRAEAAGHRAAAGDAAGIDPGTADDRPTGEAAALPPEAPALPVLADPRAPTMPMQAGEVRAADIRAAETRATEPPARQVAPALVAIIRAPGGSDHIVLRLEPRDLGQVELRVERPQAAAVQVHVSAEKPETLAMLVADRPRLEQALEQAGLPPHGREIVFHLEPPRDPAPGWADQSPRGGSMAFGDGGSGPPGGGPGQRQRPETGRTWAAGADAQEGPTPTWLRAGLDITA